MKMEQSPTCVDYWRATAYASLPLWSLQTIARPHAVTKRWKLYVGYSLAAGMTAWIFLFWMFAATLITSLF